jgi:hypothetical protein
VEADFKLKIIENQADGILEEVNRVGVEDRDFSNEVLNAKGKTEDVQGYQV